MNAEAWNQNHPIGTNVIYHPIIGSNIGTKVTRTRSLAWLLGGGEPVVKVENKAGGVALTALEVIG
jgi:hypothetical protein